MADASPYDLRLSHAADWRACPAYVRMNRTPQAAVIEESAPHVIREEGAAIHEAAQWMLLFGNYEGVSAGQVMKNGVTLTDEMVDAAAFYVGVLGEETDVRWIVERQLHAARIHEKCGGTPDAYGFRAASSPTILLRDLKGGYRPVDVFPNYQLFGYTAAILDSHPEYDRPDTVVEYSIIQPRAFHKYGPVRKHTMLLRDVYPFIEELRQSAAIAMGEHAQAVSGPQCDDCAARASCSVAHAAAMRALEVSGEADVHDLPVAALDYEMRRLEEAARMIEARLTGLQAQASHLIRKGVTLPHYALEAGNGRLNWIDESAEQAAIVMGDLLGMNLRKPVKAITPTQAMQRMPKDLLEQYAQRKRGEVKLVRFDSNAAVKAFSHLSVKKD